MKNTFHKGGSEDLCSLCTYHRLTLSKTKHSPILLQHPSDLGRAAVFPTSDNSSFFLLI